jgi:hypothetical protein
MSSDYKVAGICCGPHPEFGKMCVLTLAGGFTDTIAAKPAAAVESTAVPSKSATSSTPSKVSSGNTNTNSGSNTSGENSNKVKTTNTKPRRR